MTEADELRARIVRLELEITNRQATMTGMYMPASRKEPITVLGVLSVLLALLLIGGVSIALADRFGIALPAFIPTASVVYSTPAALPTANVAPNAPAARVAPYTAIIEATFPPPIPDVIPTDAPAPPQATPPPVYAPADSVTMANTGPAEHTAFSCGVEPGNSPGDTCPASDPGASVYSLEGRMFSAEPLPTSSAADNKGFDSGAEPGNEPTPSR